MANPVTPAYNRGMRLSRGTKRTPRSRGNTDPSLLHGALFKDRDRGLSELLRHFSFLLRADASILWISPVSSDRSPHPICVSACWTPDGNFTPFHVLPPHSSVLGSVNASEHPWLKEWLGTATSCSVPVTFNESAAGALSFFRLGRRRFTPREIREAKRLASLTTPVLRSIHSRVGLDLIVQLSDILREVERGDPGGSRGHMTGLFRLISNVICRAFHCMDVSIFITDYPDHVGARFEKVASSIDATPDFFPECDTDEAVAWAIKNRKSIHVFDICQSPDEFAKKSAGLSPSFSSELVLNLLRPQDLAPKRGGHPFSMMVGPIVKGDIIYGVIRCGIVTKGPFFFDAADAALLDLIGVELGRFWSNVQSLREVQEENRSLQSLVSGLKGLNSFVHSELAKSSPDEERILQEALRVVSSVIAGAEQLEVMLLDKASMELYVAATHGQRATIESSGVHFQKGARIAVGSSPPTTASAYVAQTGEVHETTGAEDEPYATESTKIRMILAPVSVAVGDVFGVLGIGATHEHAFPAYASSIAALLGGQLALYRFLAASIGELRQAVAKLMRVQREQSQVFQDMDHQFKSPIGQAYIRLERVLRSVELGETPDRIRAQLWAVRGLCGKAKRVSFNAGLFAALARGEEISLRELSFSGQELRKIMLVAARDNSLLIDPQRRVGYVVDEASFDRLRGLKADQNLLEQAVTNILDNAFKYSYSGTRIRISLGVTRTGRVSISFVNEGIPIRASELANCVMRGWQSEEAKAVNGEGTGIGLWIVSHIMKAHSGELIIIPTDSRHTTEVKLVFPGGQR